MTVRPIIFSAPMVRALLDGPKTQTRRLITTPLARVKAGDRLYVRESGILWPRSGLFRHNVPATPDLGHFWVEKTRAEGASYNARTCYLERERSSPTKKVTPAIHMPRWASRDWLEVGEVREQRLQNITEADAVREGVTLIEEALEDPVAAFALLWDSLHTKEGERWDANPWIVALTITVHHGNIDAASAAKGAA